jgi:mannose/cellobiose epimerase-like protein (N-acyl-D-glucosamine 2-epimerase family)
LPRPIDATARRLRAWLVEHALPLWIGAGFDEQHQRFEERLTLDGRPIVNTPQRLIVQARQIHSYALAARRGWYRDAQPRVTAAYAAMLRDYYRPDGQPGWIYTVQHGGAAEDSRRDLYSHAFALLALGSYGGWTGDRGALALADETLSFLDREMASPLGGYIETLPRVDGPRRQNPHMHLFEALLNLWENTRERRYLERADAIFELFDERFFQPDRGVLLEYFDDGLAPAPGEAGHIVEPGHHCEWIWLLRWYERETGNTVQRYVDGLYAHVERHGRDRGGMLPDELLDDGTVRTPSRRLWPMTEAIKAHLLEARRGRPGAAETAVSLADTMVERFLAPAMPGGWIDRFDGADRPVGDFMPASSLYHVIGAIDELDRFVGPA